MLKKIMHKLYEKRLSLSLIFFLMRNFIAFSFNSELCLER